MKKVILAFDGTHFSKGAFEFVRMLNERVPLLVTGIFVPQQDYANLWSYAEGSSWGPAFIPLLENEESETIRKNIERFEMLCQEHGIAYRVHRDFFDFVLPELNKESRFADVLILGGEVFYQQAPAGSQFEYIRHLLHKSECPVLIVPENYDFPKRNILAYDGSKESVYAIKQFAYIFPELAMNPTQLVYAEEDADKAIPSLKMITELANQHYKHLTITREQLNPEKFFSTWVGEKKASILVSGSFSRSALSELFKKSFVADIVQDHQVPVFIAHK